MVACCTYDDFLSQLLHRTFYSDDLDTLAASVSFYAILSFLPFVLLAVSIAGFFLASSEKALTDINNFIAQNFPGAAATTLKIFLDTVEGRTIFGIIGLVGTLWGSQRIFSVLEFAMNKIWGCYGHRSYWLSKLMALGAVPVMIIFVLLSIFLTSVLRLAQQGTIPFLKISLVETPVVGSVVSFIIPLIFSTAFFTAIYYFLPSKWNHIRAASIGALVAGVMWEIAKLLFDYYVKHFGNLLTVYGSFTSIALLLFWVYYSAFVLLFGAVFGALIQNERERRLNVALEDSAEE